MLEEILHIVNVENAVKRVISNGGSAGVDGMQTDKLRDFLSAGWQTLKQNILEENYQPQAVRKVEIPKPHGGTRILGIPTVIDRMLQQSINQWMSHLWEADFSSNSYGFRPN